MAAAARPVWPPAQGLPQLTTGDEVHLIGIGGAGMSGLARALSSAGLVVSGCDQNDSAVLTELSSEGIVTYVGHDVSHLDRAPKLLVHSPAIDASNIELAAGIAAGVPITRRAVLLGALLDARLGVAIAGTHGKTTTSGLIATIVTASGLTPSFFVGGRVTDLGTNARLGAGDILVIEADEYDRSFLNGHPTIAVVTTVEHDHPDIYPTEADVLDAFSQFVALVKPGGLLLVNAESAQALRVAEKATVEVQTYYVDSGDPLPDDVQPEWRARTVEAGPSGQKMEVWHDEEFLGRWALTLPGRHNLGNALAAIAVAERLGVDRTVTQRVLSEYRGAERRFDVLGSCGGVTVVDDYAHHPTEVAAAIQAAKQACPEGRIHAILQPHTYTRVEALADDFALSLADADSAIVTPIYAAREPAIEGVDAYSIASSVNGATVAADLEHAAHLAVDGAASDDALLFMGAGDITRSSRLALSLLQQRGAQQLVETAAERGLGGLVSLESPLSENTSLHVGGPADVAVVVRAIDELAGWWLLARDLGLPVRVLGRGTNVLVGDRGYRGLVLINRCEGWEIQANGDDKHALLTAESGVTLAALGAVLARQGWGGLESGAGIPGSLGAAVVTNAGAHGWSVDDNLVSAEVLAADGTTRIWSQTDVAPRYRGSALKGDADLVVLRVSLRLVKESPEVLNEKISGYSAHRRRTQPSDPSIGSIFKNPSDDHAGRLIDAVGLKGRRSGGALISPKHANFFVNHEQATAADFHSLIDTAQRTVREQYGVDLELEIELMGENGV